MKKILLALVLSLMTSSVFAWEYDMSKVTCEEISNDEELATMMIFWLDGYISAEQNDTTIDEEWIDELSSGLQEGCNREPHRNLLDIVRKDILE